MSPILQAQRRACIAAHDDDAGIAGAVLVAGAVGSLALMLS